MIAWIFTSCSHFAVPVIRLRSHTDFPHTLRWVLCGNIQKPIVPSLSLNLLLVPSLVLCMSVYVSVSRAEVKRIFFFWEPFFSETWINEDWDFLLLFISTCWSPTESFWNKVLICAKLSRYSPDCFVLVYWIVKQIRTLCLWVICISNTAGVHFNF